MIHFTNTHGVIAPNGTMVKAPADMRTRHEPKAAKADEQSNRNYKDVNTSEGAVYPKIC